MRNLSLTILFVFSMFSSWGQQLPQQWIRTFQAQGKISDRIDVIITDIDGNVYVAGYMGAHHGSPDAFAMKRDAQGDTLWVYTYDGGTNKDDYATDIVVDDAGNTYITGYSDNASYVKECFTAKLFASGTPAWVVRYSPGSNTQTYGNAITVDAYGNVYVVGYTDPTSGSNDWLVIKYNSAGVQQWVDVLNGPGNGEDAALDIIIAPNGNPTVCGYAYSLNASGNINAFVKQYTPAGVTVWTDTWTNPAFTGIDKAYGIGIDSSGNLYTGGETRNSTTSNMDAYAIRYDSLGVRQWVTIYTDATTTTDEYLRQVIVDSLGNVFFAGTDYQNAYVTCIRSDGSQGWRKKWIGPVAGGMDVFHGIAADHTGNVYATGRGVYPGPDYYGNGGTPNVIIVKYSANGDSLWTYRCQDSLNSSMAFSLAYRNGKIYSGGFVTDTAWVDENLYTVIIDTSGNAITEWNYNGRGDALTFSQFVETDTLDNIYCAATVDRLYYEGTDIALIKYDPSGNLLWEKYYSSPGFNNDTITAMQFDPSGNLILCISSDIGKLKNNYRLTIVKVNGNGLFTDTIWTGATGSVLATSLDIFDNGSMVIGANSSINGGIVLYYDSAFATTWTSKIDTTQFAITKVNTATFFNNGDIAAGGYSQVSGINAGIVKRFDSTGNILWNVLIDSLSVADEIKSISIDNFNDVAYTGKSGNKALIGKINGTTGSVAWRQVYNPTTTSEYGVKVKFTPAGNIAFICRGWTGSVARYITVQYSTNGVFQWATVYSQTASNREPIDILVESSNRIVTAGWAINTYSTNYDYVLVGYNSSGVAQFTNTYTSGASAGWDQLFDLTRDSQGNFIITGRSATEFFNNYLFKMITIKYGGIVVSEEPLTPAQSNMAIAYPNPSTNGLFTLIDASPFSIISSGVFDLQGRLIGSLNLETFEIDIHNARPGIYFLVYKRSNSSTEKIMLVITE